MTRFIEWATTQGIFNLQDLDNLILEDYRRQLNRHRKRDGQPLDISTQCARLMAVTKFIKNMDYYDVIDSTFAKKFRLPRISRRLPKDIPTVPDIERELDQALIMGRLGLRNRDIDFQRQTLAVREGKNKNDRNVPIAHRALDWVERYLKEMRPSLASLSSGGALFVTEAGQRMKSHKVTDMVTKCVNRLGIDKKRCLPSVA